MVRERLLRQRSEPLPNWCALPSGYQLDFGVVQTQCDQCGGRLYVLHLDGTCEPGTHVIFIAMAGHQQWVLVAATIPSENVEGIKHLIQGCIARFGLPVAIVRDLSPNIQLALQDPAWGDRLSGVRQFVCQYHLLANIGEKLCQKPHAELTKQLRAHKIKPSLSSLRRDLVRYSKAAPPQSAEAFHALLQNPSTAPAMEPRQLRRQWVYSLIRWIDDCGAELQGEYFPFDLPALALYRRCATAYRRLGDLLGQAPLPPQYLTQAQTLQRILAPVAQDAKLRQAAQRLEKAECRFGQLKRGWRRRLGAKTLVRQLQGSRAEELLVANLEDPTYLEVVCRGDASALVDRFPEHWAAAHQIRKERSEAESTRPLRMSKTTLRDPDFLNQISRVFECQLAAPAAEPEAAAPGFTRISLQ